jgi:predicted RNase H-like HicB family nuclease
MKIVNKIGINIVIEREKGKFIATSPDINVFAEGNNVDEAIKKFEEGTKSHLESFPEERNNFPKENNVYEMPIVAKIFL